MTRVRSIICSYCCLDLQVMMEAMRTAVPICLSISVSSKETTTALTTGLITRRFVTYLGNFYFLPFSACIKAINSSVIAGKSLLTVLLRQSLLQWSGRRLLLQWSGRRLLLQWSGRRLLQLWYLVFCSDLSCQSQCPPRVALPLPEHWSSTLKYRCLTQRR